MSIRLICSDIPGTLRLCLCNAAEAAEHEDEFDNLIHSQNVFFIHNHSVLYIIIRLQRYNLFWYLTIKKTFFPLYFFQILNLNNLLPCKYSSINQIRKSLMVCQIFLHSLVFSPKGLHLLSLYTTYRNLLPNGIRKIQSS